MPPPHPSQTNQSQTKNQSKTIGHSQHQRGTHIRNTVWASHSFIKQHICWTIFHQLIQDWPSFSCNLLHLRETQTLALLFCDTLGALPSAVILPSWPLLLGPVASSPKGLQRGKWWWSLFQKHGENQPQTLVRRSLPFNLILIPGHSPQSASKHYVAFHYPIQIYLLFIQSPFWAITLIGQLNTWQVMETVSLLPNLLKITIF